MTDKTQGQDAVLAGAELDGIVAFVQAAAALKDTLRSGHTVAGRPESTAEHSWRLTLLAMLAMRRVPGVDALRLMELCVVHDLGEALAGDVPATEQAGMAGRDARERAALDTLCAPLPVEDAAHILALYDEYVAAATAEARLARGLDKIETVLSHAIGANPDDFDYGFNLTYGAARTDAHPLLRALRDRADAATRAQMAGARPLPGG